MSIEQRLIEGIISASDKTWNYRKDLLEIRPEYLITVAVADKLISSGFDGICGLDIHLYLEARTRDVCFELMSGAVGLKGILNGMYLKLARKGHIDIFMTNHNRSWAIELKGFDPQRYQIEKELHRFKDILSANNWNNGCEACYLAFPMRYLTQIKVEQIIMPIIKGYKLKAVYTLESYQTGEDPEDGIAGFNILCIKITRNST